MIHVIIELTFIGLLIKDGWVGQNVIEPCIFKICSCLPGLKRLEIRIAINQSVHIGDCTVMNEVADVATTGNTNDTSRFSMFFQ